MVSLGAGRCLLRPSTWTRPTSSLSICRTAYRLSHQSARSSTRFGCAEPSGVISGTVSLDRAAGVRA